MVLFPAGGQASVEGDFGGVQGGLLGGDMSAGVHGSPDARIDAPDRVLVQMMVRIPRPNCRKGTNSAQALVHYLKVRTAIQPQGFDTQL